MRHLNLEESILRLDYVIECPKFTFVLTAQERTKAAKLNSNYMQFKG